MAQVASGKKKRPAGTRIRETLLISRTFDAPRGLVWKVWTEPDLVRRWWGPEGYTAPDIRIDLRVGGRNLYCMRSPEGKDYWSTGVFREIVPMERIVVTDSFADKKGNIVPASYYGMTGEMPLELLVTLTFQEQNGKTRFTMKHEGFPPGEIAGLAETGWNQSFDKLAMVLEKEVVRRAKTVIIAEPGKHEASVIRTFDAAQGRVHRAYTEPELMEQWWAPRRFTTVVEQMDVRPGGFWRIVNRDARGNAFWFHGVYHEVSPTRLVWTFEYEGMPGHVLLGIVTFEETDGKTKVTEKSIFESVEDRDGMMRSGMEEGAFETMDRLAELVEIS